MRRKRDPEPVYDGPVFAVGTRVRTVKHPLWCDQETGVVLEIKNGRHRIRVDERKGQPCPVFEIMSGGYCLEEVK